MYDSDTDVKRVVDVAKGLEGLKRSDGIHAAAVVITKEPVTHYLPIQRKPESGQDPAEAPVVTQFEMGGVESLGLLKMDFLGLRNLDVITDAQAMIRRSRDPEFDIDTIPLDDRLTFDLLGRGDTIGVFQLESPPMRQLLRAMTPNSFDDVGALIALYRPGPMSANMHYDYADRKNGRKPVEYFHADAEELLHDTFGLMIYQESVIRVAQKFAGYSLAEGDLLRKSMGKKSREVMAKERVNVRGGLRTQRIRHASASRCSTSIERFADYAFNKSHSYGYGLDHVPDRVPQGPLPGRVLRLPADQRQEQPRQGRGVPLRLPVGRHQGADARHQPFGRRLRRAHRRSCAARHHAAGRPARARSRSGCRRCATSARALVELLVAERDANGEFTSFHDFAERVPEPVLNKRTVESLIKAGAFDRLGHPGAACSPPSSRSSTSRSNAGASATAA